MTTLEEAARQLQRTIDLVEEDLRAKTAGFGYDVDPDLMRDPNGRYILLDARVALVNAMSAMERFRSQS